MQGQCKNLGFVACVVPSGARGAACILPGAPSPQAEHKPLKQVCSGKFHPAHKARRLGTVKVGAAGLSEAFEIQWPINALL
jgi:hypothetical protein